MCPFPIMPVNDRRESISDKQQDIYNLLPLMMNPIAILQDSLSSKKDKEAVREIWLKSETLDDGRLKVNASIADRDIFELISKGLIDGDGRIVSFTVKGEKMLKESILSDETSALQKKASLFKKASKKLVAKNSYDFGDEVLIRTENKERFGTRYINIPKSAFAAKTKAEPREIDQYKIATRNESGDYKDLKDYSEDELIQTLHLAKNLILNHRDVSNKLAQTGDFLRLVPVNRLKSFSILIMEELNSR